MPTRWWRDEPRELYWLESTDRADIGVDLRAPLADESGRENWRYTLFQEAKAGDLVFHYDKNQSAITSVSRIAGPSFEAPIIWAARGSYARERGAVPAEVPGYRVPLSDHTFLSEPVSLAALRSARPMLKALVANIGAAKATPLYFPFELSDRPIRPLQGYAFKLPADFVAAFPAMAAAASLSFGRQAARGIDKAQLFQAAVASIEAAAHAYKISNLQLIRARIRGQQRVARTIFGPAPKADTWTFHYGGRSELQFNVGLEDAPDGSSTIRTGVALSFQLSRSLPDIDALLPKVGRFNAWVREHPEALEGLSMWHWRHGERSDDRMPGPIPESLVRPGYFVFMGDRQAINPFDPHRALRTFDRLLSLYEWVEDDRQPYDSPIPDAATVALDRLRLDGGRDIEGGRWIAASLREQTLDIFLRHAEMQLRLRDQLRTEGYDRVVLEVPLGEKFVDVVALRGAELSFFEVKTAATVRGCLREAIGQLLEYALWPGATRPNRLVVVGEPALDASAAAYLTALNAAFPIPLEYRRLSLKPVD